MSRKIVLIFPGKFNSPFPGMPIVLLYLGGILIKHGYEVKLVDTRIEKIENVNFKNVLCVGISSMTGHQISYGIKAVRYIKRINSEVPIIWGGIHPTMLPYPTAKSKYVDIVVHGEGEITLPILVHRLENRNSLEDIKGIAFKDSTGDIVVNPKREFINLDIVPIKLPYHLLQLEKYRWNFFIQTSRGCPHRCGYCYNLFYCNQKYRTKSVEKVLNEIEYVITKFDLTQIGFDCDDAFFTDKDRVKKICRGFIKRNLDLYWTAPARFDYFANYDKDFLKLLLESGCKGLTFGGDSGSNKILSLINKDITTHHMTKALRNIKDCIGTNLKIDVNFILGFPTENLQDLKKTFKIMNTLSSIYPHIRYGITIYTPYPGTPLYKKAIKKFNFNPPNNFEEWGKYNFSTFKTPWVDKKYYKIIETLSAISRVDFYSKNYKIPKRFNNFPYNLIYKLFSSMGYIRWKYKFFNFPIEWKTAKKYIEYKRGYF